MDGGQVDRREIEIRRLIDDGKNITEIAKLRGVHRQAVWEFCARRGWLGDESFSKMEAKDARRRKNRRVVLPPGQRRVRISKKKNV